MREGYYIENINFKERVPTTAEGSAQGDHTVAETLIEASIKALIGRGVSPFLNSLLRVMENNLTGEEKAYHTDEAEGVRSAINTKGVYEEIHAVSEAYERGEIDLVHLQRILSELTTKVWRLLSKRENTAFLRKEGRTTGGGGGAGESAAMKAAASVEVPGGLDYVRAPFIEQIATLVAPLIDAVPTMFTRDELLGICRRAATHIAEVLEIGNSDWINRVAANIYFLKTGEKIAPRSAPPKFHPDFGGDGSAGAGGGGGGAGSAASVVPGT